MNILHILLMLSILFFLATRWFVDLEHSHSLFSSSPSQTPQINIQTVVQNIQDIAVLDLTYHRMSKIITLKNGTKFGARVQAVYRVRLDTLEIEQCDSQYILVLDRPYFEQHPVQILHPHLVQNDDRDLARQTATATFNTLLNTPSKIKDACEKAEMELISKCSMFNLPCSIRWRSR